MSDENVEKDQDQKDILNWMRELNIPITRQTYIEFIYGDDIPEKWGAEAEAQLPLQLQDWTKVVPDDM